MRRGWCRGRDASRQLSGRPGGQLTGHSPSSHLSPGSQHGGEGGGDQPASRAHVQERRRAGGSREGLLAWVRSVRPECQTAAAPSGAPPGGGGAPRGVANTRERREIAMAPPDAPQRGGGAQAVPQTHENRAQRSLTRGTYHITPHCSGPPSNRPGPGYPFPWLTCAFSRTSRAGWQLEPLLPTRHPPASSSHAPTG